MQLCCVSFSRWNCSFQAPTHHSLASTLLPVAAVQGSPLFSWLHRKPVVRGIQPPRWTQATPCAPFSESPSSVPQQDASSPLFPCQQAEQPITCFTQREACQRPGLLTATLSATHHDPQFSSQNLPGLGRLHQEVHHFSSSLTFHLVFQSFSLSILFCCQYFLSSF